VVEQLLVYLDGLVEEPANVVVERPHTVDTGDSTTPSKEEASTHQRSESHEARLAVALHVVEQIGEFVWVGSRPLELSEDDLLIYSPYNEDSFPPPASAAGDKGKEGCIRNLEPLKIIQNFILEVRSDACV
jgi:hypothetical protein